MFRSAKQLLILSLTLLSSSLAFGQDRTLMELRQGFMRPTEPMYLPNNPYSKEKEELGKALFFDPRLSGTNSMSCATCHNPKLGWTDGRAKALGAKGKELQRKTPTIINLGWTYSLMWDGALDMLEGQVLTPIGKKDEMHMNLAKLPSKLAAIPGYKAMFEKAFPGQPITNELVAQAIAVFERGLLTRKSRFNSWLDGQETLKDSEKRGLLVFANQGRCMNCHAGWRLTDESFQDLGLKSKDKGRGALFPTEKNFQFAFRTPGLHDISRRAPYMHDGSLKTLREVIEFYERGGDVERPSLSSSMSKLKLTEQDKQDLEAFLNALTSQDPEVEPPVLPN